MIPAQQGLERLREGNRRFVAGLRSNEAQSHHLRRLSTADGQSPFAIILGCSDSRVPAEIIFDQGLGDLFVIRIAGNIVAPSQIGSVEFAASQFGTPLVVVLGHSQCGAVLATLNYLQNPQARDQSANSRSILERIRPAIHDLVDSGNPHEAAALTQACIRANVIASVDHLRHGSDLLEQLISEKKLCIVGAEYSLETGAVEFF